ncbi:MAG: hypothetical protein JNK47_09235 [Mesorhizobium sp.]|nr:hypothetical protein [Mesorhizobium sp.]MBL8577395.1 hypothetical protein [Mesorhizobium sp.]
MRIRGTVIVLAAIVASHASASSIVTLADSTAWPSVVTLGAEGAIDPSIVAATPATAGPSPSIVTLADTPSGSTSSIIALGDPAPSGEAVAASPSQRGLVPIVIRGGEVGDADPQPAASPAQASTPAQLDPNDKGTPAKRKALRRQAEKMAQDKANAAQGTLQPDPTTQASAPGS